jgi:hypothetical protein
VAITPNAFRSGAVVFINWLDFASASSASNLIVRIRLKANTVSTAQLIQAGRISEWRLRLTCAASPGAFGTVQVKELPSFVDHFADGLP